MAYCVQCGVELHPTEQRCPLCSCPVRLPPQQAFSTDKRPYPPASKDQLLRTSPYMLLLITALFLLLPALICMTVNLLDNNGAITWSIYPSGALGMIFLPLAVVITAKKHRPAVAIVAADVAICLFLWMVQASAGGAWFSIIVFPVLLLSGMGALAIWFSVRKKILRGLSVFAVSIMMIGLIALAIDLLLSSRAGLLRIRWSIFVIIPCTVLALMLWIIHRSPSLRSLLGRVFHL